MPPEWQQLVEMHVLPKKCSAAPATAVQQTYAGIYSTWFDVTLHQHQQPLCAAHMPICVTRLLLRAVDGWGTINVY
jgi:hypothetical protein